jgi:uncharacterized membrane protein required for colicin V production
MIPVEFLWLVLVGVFAVVAMGRGLWKELGVSCVMLLTLFVLKFGWNAVGAKIVESFPGSATPATVEALYYIVPTAFMAFISYQGISLTFPIKQTTGLTKAILGFPGGILNGYLIVGTFWDAFNLADYFGLKVPMGSTGTMVAVSESVTPLYNTLVQYLPVTFVNEFIMLGLGMILLVAIILK